MVQSYHDRYSTEVEVCRCEALARLSRCGLLYSAFSGALIKLVKLEDLQMGLRILTLEALPICAN